MAAQGVPVSTAAVAVHGPIRVSLMYPWTALRGEAALVDYLTGVLGVLERQRSIDHPVEPIANQ